MEFLGAKEVGDFAGSLEGLVHVLGDRVFVEVLNFEVGHFGAEAGIVGQKGVLDCLGLDVGDMKEGDVAGD